MALSGPAGRLVARHDPPEAPPPAHGPRAAIVCHPHPLFGGTLENKVVHGVARALREAGLHVLRFNFRGAGGSDGIHDAGVGEVDDARAAIERVLQLAGPAAAGPGRLLVAGYSFGSFVGLSAALGDERVGARLAVAPPVNFYDYSRIADGGPPLAVIYAPGDEIVPAALVERWVAGCRPPALLVPVHGTGHEFHGQVHALREAVAAWLAVLSRPPAAC